MKNKKLIVLAGVVALDILIGLFWPAWASLSAIEAVGAVTGAALMFMSHHTVSDWKAMSSASLETKKLLALAMDQLTKPSPPKERVE